MNLRAFFARGARSAGTTHVPRSHRLPGELLAESAPSGGRARRARGNDAYPSTCSRKPPDFFRWQRVCGATDAAATRANGNADDDHFGDAADLAVWQLLNILGGELRAVVADEQRRRIGEGFTRSLQGRTPFQAPFTVVRAGPPISP